jgi:type VI secretion system secreted protein Hcp
MSMAGFLEINAENQGKIEGSCIKEGVKDTIEIYSFEHKIDIPQNKETGLYVGIRAHRPIVFEKELDKSSPKLFQALCTGEKLSEMKFNWFRFAGGEKPEKYYSIQLTNANIVSLNPFVQLRQDKALEEIPHLEKICITYEKIRWTWIPDGGEFEDSWLGEK